MAWVKTVMKPVKTCMENPFSPLRDVFSGHDWRLSGGTKQAGIVAAAFILALDCKTVVEIGVWQGFSSGMLAKALACNTADGLLVSVDISARNMEHSKAAVAGLPVRHLPVVTDSMDVDYGKVLGARAIDLAFVDGNHTYEYAMHDMTRCAEKMATWGVMVVHDYSKAAHPGVYAAVNDFVARTGFPMFFLDENRFSTDYRTAIIQKKGKY